MNTIACDIEIYEKEPKDFFSESEVAACYIEDPEKRLLFLERSIKEVEPGRWGVPGGRVEKNETLQAAAIRELYEETGILIEDPSHLQYVKTFYIRKFDSSFTYHMFKMKLTNNPNIILSEEHQNYRWATREELENMPLMGAAKEILQHYRKSFRKHVQANVSTYLFLKKDNMQILLQHRKNTGYCDGQWGLVAGHVEENESATQAMRREAKEEIGIDIEPKDLQVVHVMHRKTNRYYVDIFFTCSIWQGEIKNLEPNKCEKVEFFSLKVLPENIIPYIAHACQAIGKQQFYSEMGWESL